MDLAPTVIPRSDQINADDLLASPVTVTIVEVTKGTPDQPVNIVTKEFGPKRPYKPAKSMRRVMIAGWGADTSAYPGRQLTLFRDPHVKFAGEEIGGIRISAMSHLTEPLSVALTVTRGKRSPYVVQPIKGSPAPVDEAAVAEYLQLIPDTGSLADLKELWAQIAEDGLGKHPALVAAKDARKTELTEEEQ